MAGVVVALAVGVELWRIHSANAIGYETVPVERGPVQASVTATGTLNAVVDVQVGSQVSGNIKALYADFNTKVTKGQLVAEIDPQVFQTQVDQATAALASVHSGALTAGAQVQKAKSDLAGTMASEKGVESDVGQGPGQCASMPRISIKGKTRCSAQGLISQQDHDRGQSDRGRGGSPGGRRPVAD